MAKRPLPTDLAKLSRAALRLSKSGVALSRVLEILAQRDGDVGTVANRLPRVEDGELRQGFAALARLVRELESRLGHKDADQPEAALPAAREVFPTDAPTIAAGAAIDRVKMFVDGGARGNPGPAAIGMVFTDMTGHVLWQSCRCLEGETTNNVAEYEALREGLFRAIGQGWKKVHAFSDSELMVRQMLGRYKIKHPPLQKLAFAVRGLVKQLDAFTISQIPREHNRLADKLVAHALKNATE